MVLLCFAISRKNNYNLNKNMVRETSYKNGLIKIIDVAVIPGDFLNLKHKKRNKL